MRFNTPVAAALAVVIPTAFAQTSTDCDPTEKTCPNDTGLNTASYTADFTQGSSANSSWSAAAYTSIEYGSNGAVFEIAKSGQAPTIETDFYIFGGRVDVTMKAATGTGIVSSIVLESDDLDEIDWEFLGGSVNAVQSNFFGKGNTTSYERVQYHDVSDTQGTWHTYSVDWNKDRIEWIIDGTTVRTLTYSNELTVYGQNYPQTPMRLKLGNWAGGDSSNEGTVEWAGGKTDFSDGPFKMYVQKVSITNYNAACEYKYGDKTGSWDSIDIITSGCTVTGGSNSSSSATSASGSTASTSSVESTATVAPSSSHSVDNVEQTKVAVSKTITGSPAPSASAHGTGAIGVSTGVPSAPTPGVNGTMTSGTGTNTVTGPSSTSDSTEQSTGGASAKGVMVGGSLLSVALSLFML